MPDDNPSPPSESREDPKNQLLAAISHAIFDCIAPVVAGTSKQGGPAELAPIDKGFMWLRLMPQRRWESACWDPGRRKRIWQLQLRYFQMACGH